MSTAFITGGLGLIGSTIARVLLAGDTVDRVVCLDHFGHYVDFRRPEFTDYRQLRLRGVEDRVIVERGDAGFFSVINRLLDQYRPKYVFHLAALPLAKLDNLNSEEAREGTVVSTSNLMEALGQLKARDGYCPERFVYASSSMVYGTFQQDEIDETHPLAPIEIYGTMKLAGEVVTQGLGRFFGIPTAVVRPSAVYGPTDMNRRVTQIFLEKAFLGQTLDVQGADEPLDFTYVEDIARGFVLAATRPEAVGEVFNITYGRAHTLLDFVHCLRSHFPDLDFKISERDAFRPRRGTLSIAKANRLLGYEPRFSLEEGVAAYVAFVKSHHPLFSRSD